MLAMKVKSRPAARSEGVLKRPAVASRDGDGEHAAARPKAKAKGRAKAKATAALPKKKPAVKVMERAVSRDDDEDE